MGREHHGFSLLEILFVMGLTVVVAAVAVPMAGNLVGNYRLSGDARGLSNAMAQAKLRAAAAFTTTRLFVDLNGNVFHLETWRRSGPPGWVTEGGVTYLSGQDVFSLGAVSAPPPGTQAATAQAPPCLDAANNPIGNSACVVFNSRGIPVDATSSPTAADALYLTDGTAVYGVTVAATGFVRVWRTPPTATPAWSPQ
jgi:hypothetical protein